MRRGWPLYSTRGEVKWQQHTPARSAKASRCVFRRLEAKAGFHLDKAKYICYPKLLPIERMEKKPRVSKNELNGRT